MQLRRNEVDELQNRGLTGFFVVCTIPYQLLEKVKEPSHSLATGTLPLAHPFNLTQRAP